MKEKIKYNKKIHWLWFPITCLMFLLMFGIDLIKPVHAYSYSKDIDYDNASLNQFYSSNLINHITIGSNLEYIYDFDVSNYIGSFASIANIPSSINYPIILNSFFTETYDPQIAEFSLYSCLYIDEVDDDIYTCGYVYETSDNSLSLQDASLFIPFYNMGVWFDMPTSVAFIRNGNAISIESLEIQIYDFGIYYVNSNNGSLEFTTFSELISNVDYNFYPYFSYTIDNYGFSLSDVYPQLQSHMRGIAETQQFEDSYLSEFVNSSSYLLQVGITDVKMQISTDKAFNTLVINSQIDNGQLGSTIGVDVISPLYNSNPINRSFWSAYYNLSKSIVDNLPTEPIPPVEITPVDMASWLVTSVGAFMNSELFPGFAIGGIFAVMVAFPLVIWFLKLVLGG